MADTPDVPAPVRTLAAQVAEPTPMRRGSLSERYVKCSKAPLINKDINDRA
jgi:hypothetical protein